MSKKGTDYEMASKSDKSTAKGGPFTFPQATPVAKKRKANNSKAPC